MGRSALGLAVFAALLVAALAATEPPGSAVDRPAASGARGAPVAVAPAAPALRAQLPAALRGLARPREHRFLRTGRAGGARFPGGWGPCIRLCTYLARAGQGLTTGCPAVAPEGCTYLVAARAACAAAPPRPPALRLVPAPRVIPLPRAIPAPRVVPTPPVVPAPRAIPMPRVVPTPSAAPAHSTVPAPRASRTPRPSPAP